MYPLLAPKTVAIELNVLTGFECDGANTLGVTVQAKVDLVGSRWHRAWAKKLSAPTQSDTIDWAFESEAGRGGLR